MTFEQLMDKARETNRYRDEFERKHGLRTPMEAGPEMVLRTAMEAITAGLKTKEESCTAEGLAMLEEMLERFAAIRKAKQQ